MDAETSEAPKAAVGSPGDLSPPTIEPIEAEVEFRRHVSRIQAAAHGWDMAPDSAERSYMLAMLGALNWMAAIVTTAQADLATTVRRCATIADTLNSEGGEILFQARSAVVGAQARQDDLALQLAQALLPIIRDKLKSWPLSLEAPAETKPSLIRRVRGWTIVKWLRRTALVVGAGASVAIVAGAWNLRQEAAMWKSCEAHAERHGSQTSCVLADEAAPHE